MQRDIFQVDMVPDGIAFIHYLYLLVLLAKI